MTTAAGVYFTILLSVVQSDPTGFQLRSTGTLDLEDVDDAIEAGFEQAIGRANWPSLAVSLRQTHRLANAKVLAFTRQRLTPAGETPVFRWVARRIAIDGEGLSVGYTDSVHCPALESALILAEQLEPPRIELTGIPIGSMEDASTLRLNVSHEPVMYTLRLRLGYYPQTGSRGKVEWTADAPTALGAWAESTETAMAGCWTSELPPPSVD